IGDEDDAVDSLQNELARRVVEDLSGNGVELDSGLESADDADVEGQKVEKQGSIRFGLERHHLAAGSGRCAPVDVMEVRGLPAETRTLVNDLGRHLHRGVVKEDH